MEIGCQDLDLAGTLPNYVKAIRAPRPTSDINAGTDKRSSELPPKAGQWNLAEMALKRSTCSLHLPEATQPTACPCALQFQLSLPRRPINRC